MKTIGGSPSSMVVKAASTRDRGARAAATATVASMTVGS